jgi:hypothetical protein
MILGMAEKEQPRWRPLSVRRSGRTQDFDALHEGVPPWMLSSLMGWTLSTVSGGIGIDGMAEPVMKLSRILHRDLGLVTSQAGLRDFTTKITNDENLFLDVVDAMLQHGFTHQYVGRLQEILDEAGSAWTLGPGLRGLERRVPDAVAKAAREAITPKDRASAHLSKAWNHVFGRNPDASDGYRESIRAVEAVAQPIIEPNNSKATLGTMIGALRSQPNKWSIGLHHPDPRKQAQDLAGTMNLLWKGQHDRHGTGDPPGPSRRVTGGSGSRGASGRHARPMVSFRCC